jgi:RND superfamily putative drug exporter
VLARFILQHKILVLLAWAAIAIAAVLTFDRLEPALDYTYSTPGQIGYDSDVRITRHFGIDPAFEAEMPVLELPAGLTMASPEGQALAAKTFAAARTSGPVIVQDYATTRDPKFLLDGGRATWALISIPNPDYGPAPGSRTGFRRSSTRRFHPAPK